MKQFIFFLSLIITFTACDKENPYPAGSEPTPPVDPSEPFIGTLITPSVLDPADALSSVTKNVLLEDYTGFKCTNCPDAHQVAEAIRDEHGTQVVIMSMHVSTSFASPNGGSVFPDPFSQDFRTEAGEAYLTQFGIQGLPSGLINRDVFNGQMIVGFGAWASTVDAVVNETGQVNIEMGDVTYANDTLDIFCEMEFLEDLEGDFYVSMHLVEDEVISAQTNGGSVILDYLQKDVHRGALNGNFGDLVTANAQDLDLYSLEGHYYLPGTSTTPDIPNPQIEIDDCHVVVFIYKLNESAGIFEVFQVVKKDVTI